MTSLPLSLPDSVFRHMFQSSPLATLVRDANGSILAVNAAFETLFGVQADRLLGCDLRQALRPASPANGQETIFLDGRDPAFSEECRWAVGEGDVVDVTVSQFPIGTVDDQPLFCVIFRDIANRRRAEAQLQATERKYHAIFENAVEGIFQTTPQGRYLEANRTLARIYGFQSVTEMTDYFRDIKSQLYVDPSRRDDFIRLLAAHDEVHRFESRIRKKDGAVIWISENARVVRNADGQPIYYEGTVVDITDRKRAEEALATQRAYFTQLFANSPQAIALIDMQGHKNTAAGIGGKGVARTPTDRNPKARRTHGPV